MRYTLMNQRHEVLSFSYVPESRRVEDVRPLDDVAWAPLEVPTDGRDPTPALAGFLRTRAIALSRSDLPHILHACGATSAVELALRSGGFSLSDQYWYRGEGSSLTWEGSNFFDNEWDTSFGESLLRRDYDALGRASIFTPDITMTGFCRKAWVPTERGLRLLKESPTGDEANIHCEALVSRMLDRLVGEDGHVRYEPMSYGGELYSASPVMLGRNDELVSGGQLLERAGVDTRSVDAQVGLEGFDQYMALYQRTLEDAGVTDWRQRMAKLFVMATLALDFDTHHANFGLVRDVETLALRQAPLFDHGRAFLFLKDRFEAVHDSPAALMLILGRYFSRLDPSWDYSWYDPHALDGFEDEIFETLSTLGSLPDGYAELMATLFVKQRDYVNYVAHAG